MLERQAWPRVLPFVAYLAFIFIADLLTRQGVDAASLRWLYPVKIAIVLGLLLAYWRRYEELRPARLDWRAAVTAVAAGVLVLVLWINLNAGWMTLGEGAGFDPMTNGKIDWLLVTVRIAGAALVVPVMEELFWRSYLMRWIVAPRFQQVAPAQLGLRSFVVTVVLFGVEHNLWLAGMVAGAVYGLLYMRSGSLWSPILAHGVTNGLLGGWIISTAHWTYW
ncbi:CAAX prenyl protease-related protein [Rugamonas apoptosis]|uniref:CAAX prenyl protease-related protein n=1 Tax=Rugamonas apoptosis TaxID=2758570 RepID=A0A7W2IMV3_9BURK|nr:CAAX prenyl protease-related protein [Rugamonas apoptosis]MBA5690078.1 CAAX prenyl protease-related protein [Rugamonas apoptosis]